TLEVVLVVVLAGNEQELAAVVADPAAGDGQRQRLGRLAAQLGELGGQLLVVEQRRLRLPGRIDEPVARALAGTVAVPEAISLADPARRHRRAVGALGQAGRRVLGGQLVVRLRRLRRRLLGADRRQR